MFRPSRGSDQSKIKLPKQTMAPGVRELQQLYEQARENRAREVEMVWQVPGTTHTYSIHVKFDRVTPHPIWNIWEDNGREAKMVWRFETSDVHMIYDVVAMLEVAHQKTTGTVQTVNQSQAFNSGVSGQFGTRQGMQAMSPSGLSGQFGTRQGMPAMSPPGTTSSPSNPISQTRPAPVNNVNTSSNAMNDGWRTVEPTNGPTQSNQLNQNMGASGGFPSPGMSANLSTGSHGIIPSPQSGNAGGGLGGNAGGGLGGGMAQSIQQAANNLATGSNHVQQQQTSATNYQQQSGANFPQQSPKGQFGEISGSFQQQAPSTQFGEISGNFQQAAKPSGAAPSMQQMPDGTLPADFFSDAPATVAAAPPVKNNSMEGSIEQHPMNDVLTNIGMQQLTGKLEVAGASAVGHVYFENGIPKDAQTSNNRGDDAIKELVTWRSGSYLFKPSVRTEMHSVEKSLQTSVMEGIALLDQLKHLEKAGLVYESILSQKQKNLGEPELKLMLSKGVQLDFNTQKDVYESLKHKTTFTDLLRDRPMEQTQWAPLLFNLLYCGLIEIRPPASTRGGALDFLGESKQIIQNLAYNFVRTDTGVMSCEALLYFMEYEYYRYEAYGFPMSLVVFELMLKRTGGSGIIEKDPLPVQALNTAAMRIGLVKRPLDTFAHFYGQDFAILMPNTKASQAAFVANRVLDSLTVTPLAPGIDKANLSLAFGVANLPSDGEDLESMIQAAVDAHSEAREGTFPIVLARTSKRD
jgi:hypothetical protein